MADINNPLWYEDLESHRQPALYYLSSREVSSGPHLICDWNGPPTDYEEFNLDIISCLVNSKLAKVKENGDSEHDPHDNNGKPSHYLSSSNSSGISRNSNRTVLLSKDSAKFDLLTVTPLVKGIVLRALNPKRLKHKDSSDTLEGGSIGSKGPKENGFRQPKKRSQPISNGTKTSSQPV